MSVLGSDAPANIGLAGEQADAIVAESIDAPTKRAKGERFPWSRVIGPILVFLGVVVFWHWMHTNGMRAIFDKPGFLVPAPETVIHESFFDPIARTALLNGIKWTAFIALIGLVITILTGIVLAVFMPSSSAGDAPPWSAGIPGCIRNVFNPYFRRTSRRATLSSALLPP